MKSKIPKWFDEGAWNNLSQDPLGRILLDAFTIDELFALYKKYRKIKEEEGIEKAQEYLNRKAEGRMNN